MTKPMNVVVVHNHLLTAVRASHERALPAALQRRGVHAALDWIPIDENDATVELADGVAVVVLLNVVPQLRGRASSVGVVKLGRRTTRLPDVSSRVASAAVELADPLSVRAAELTLSLSFALLRQTLSLDHIVRAGDPVESVRTTEGVRRPNWAGLPASSIRSVAGSTIGILGLGSIGLEVARRFDALGATVLYHQPRRLGAEFETSHGVQWVDFEELFRRSDLVSLHCKLTPQTEGIVGREQLDLLGPNSFLVNTARGGLVVDDDLVYAVMQGRIAGAALDVFAWEPPRPDWPLLRSDRVVLSPHVGTIPTDLSTRYDPVASAIATLCARVSQSGGGSTPR